MAGPGICYYLCGAILFLVALAFAPSSQFLVERDLQVLALSIYLVILLSVLMYCGYTALILEITDFEKILESNTAYDILSDAYFFALVNLLQVIAANVCVLQVPKTQADPPYPHDVQVHYDEAIFLAVLTNLFCWAIISSTSVVVGVMSKGTNSKFGNKVAAGVASTAFNFGSQLIKLVVSPEFGWKKYVSLLGLIVVGCLVVVLPKFLATFDWIVHDPRRNYNPVRDGIQLQGFDDYEGETGGDMYLLKDD